MCVYINTLYAYIYTEARRLMQAAAAKKAEAQVGLG